MQFIDLKAQHAPPVFREAPAYEETFKHANDYCAWTFSLPMRPHLEETEQQEITEAVREALCK